MKVLEVYVVRRGKHSPELRVTWERPVVEPVILLEFLEVHLKSSAQFDCDLLLLLENEFVVLHVLLCVGFQICPDLVEVEAILVCALLPIHEELAELRGAK